MINHHIVRLERVQVKIVENDETKVSYLYITMHDSHAVAVIQSPQKLIEVATYVIVGQCLKIIYAIAFQMRQHLLP